MITTRGFVFAAAAFDALLLAGVIANELTEEIVKSKAIESATVKILFVFIDISPDSNFCFHRTNQIIRRSSEK